MVMPAAVRGFVAGRLGLWLPTVKVHIGPTADALTRTANARALAFADHVAFRHGRYELDTRRGMALIGHELTHVSRAAAGRFEGTAAEETVAVRNQERLDSSRQALPPPASAARISREHPAVLTAPEEPPPALPAPLDLTERQLSRIRDTVYEDLKNRLRTEFERGA